MPAPFSETVMNHFFEPHNVGTLVAPCGEGLAGSVQRGVFMRMYARVSDNVVTDTRYLTYGCVPAIAAGSMLTTWVQGRTVEDALALTSGELVDALGGLPADRRFCAELAIEAMQSAVRNAPRISSSLGATSP